MPEEKEANENEKFVENAQCLYIFKSIPRYIIICLFHITMFFFTFLMVTIFNFYI